MPKNKRMGEAELEARRVIDPSMQKVREYNQGKITAEERRRLDARVRAPAQSGMTIDEVKKYKSRTR